MDKKQLQSIITQDNDFYTNVAPNFNATRQKPWSGWKQPQSLGDKILDIAGGNGRYYRFLRENCFSGQYLNVDASAELLAMSGLKPEQYQQLDILAAYAQNRDWRADLRWQLADSVVCFGFMHHVPWSAWRMRLLGDMFSLVKPDGFLFVSFWQFLPEKKNLIVENLGHNDYWLSWGGDQGVRRFAHYCDDAEIEYLSHQLITDYHAELYDDYQADGRSGRLNRYLLWKKPLSPGVFKVLDEVAQNRG